MSAINRSDGLRRKNVCAARDVLLENVVLHRAGNFRPWHPLLVGDCQIQRQQNRSGGVDGHGRAHLVERDAVEHLFHVGERRDGDADPADFTQRHRVVAVVPDLRRQIERHRQSRLPLREKIFVPLVRLACRAEARVLAHRPELAAIHRCVDATRERKLARLFARFSHDIRTVRSTRRGRSWDGRRRCRRRLRRCAVPHRSIPRSSVSGS